MSDMPDEIYAAIPPDGKTKAGNYSHSPTPIDRMGNPSSRKCKPREKYHHDRVVSTLTAENERLKTRLEVADHGIDGIEARDATIKMLEGENERLKELLAECEGVIDGLLDGKNGLSVGFARSTLAKLKGWK